MSDNPTRPSSNKLAGVFFVAGALMGGGADHAIVAADNAMVAADAAASYKAELPEPAATPLTDARTSALLDALANAEASYSREGM